MFFLGVFLLLVACLIVILASCLVEVVFAALTAALVRRVSRRRRIVIALKGALPFAIWALVTTPFVIAWVEAERLSFPGFAYLPNGYILSMINADDPGWLYGPTNDVPQNLWPQVADGIECVQTAGSYILGGRDSHGLNFGKVGGRVDSYFLLNENNKQMMTFSSLKDLQSAASQAGISPTLEPVLAVYFRYGPLNPIKVVWFALLPLSLALTYLVFRWAVRIREINASSDSNPARSNAGVRLPA